ncbi:MAG TPA: hypothetical protein VFJ43_10390, partial [Bacteroidia bacterium]|nr:hypothetical protein [Bacteroidia bacterium]
QACVDYLVNEKHIPAERLKAQGYGKTRPLRLPDGTILNDKYIKTKKTKQEQEALYQLDRRTVFKVLSWDYVDPNAPKDQNQRKIIHPKVNAGAFDDSGDTTGADVPDSPVDGGGTTTAPQQGGGTAAPAPAPAPAPANTGGQKPAPAPATGGQKPATGKPKLY